MFILNRIAANWSFAEREKLNINWDIIERVMSNLQMQINTISGGEDIEDLMRRLLQAIADSETTIQDMEVLLADAQVKLNQMQTALNASAVATAAANTATTNANVATNAANTATTNANTATTNATNATNAANTATTNANNATNAATNATNAATTATSNAITATNNANTATTNATTATTAALNAVTDALNAITAMQNFVDQLGNAETYDNSKTYLENNIVEYNGSSFIAIAQTQGNLPPTLPIKRNAWWQLLAQRGVDGTGAVSSVNGQGPDVNGNVEITKNTIGLNNVDNTSDLNKPISTATQQALTIITDSVDDLNTIVTTLVDEYATTQDVTYYVDAVNGNDGNDGLSASSAFKTINKALSELPNRIDHIVEIRISSGSYFEDYEVKGYNGKGYIYFIGDANNPTNVNLTGSLLVDQCINYVEFKGIRFSSGSTEDKRTEIIRCVRVQISNCIFDGGNPRGLRVFSSNAEVVNTAFYEKDHAIIAESAGQVISQNNQGGENNNVALWAVSGTIFKVGSQPNAATAELVQNGGVIR